MNKAVIPFGGSNASPGGPLIPVMRIELPITDEYKRQFEEWVEKTGLDQSAIAQLLVQLGIVSLKRIFDEETPARPAA